MIPETNGTSAVFKDGTIRPVVAWDDDGNALVPDSSGYLVTARMETDFARLEFNNYLDDPVALIPGGGWIAHYEGGGTAPVVAWGVDRYGGVQAYAQTDECHAEPHGRLLGPKFYVRHPDESEPAPAQPN